MGCCEICHSREELVVHEACEQMFGLDERFAYAECAGCGCLRLAEAPASMAKYYPSGYYAYEQADGGNRLLRSLARRRDHHVFRRSGGVGRLLNGVVGNPSLESLRRLALAPGARILDVGCGAGALLRSLHGLGFSNLQGIDPFSAGHRSTPEGIRILQLDLAQVDGVWDLIMLHHVFEHMPDSRRVLELVGSRLTAEGVCLIRTPVAGTHAWRHYGVDWVQLDAPRHLWVHSVQSLRTLAEQVGFVVEAVVFDSTSFQFWGSELYRRNISLQEARGGTFFKLFSLRQLRGYARRACVLNSEGQGDQAVFYLRREGAA